MPVKDITTAADAISLAKSLLDPYRDRVVVVVSQTTQYDLRFDAGRISRDCDGKADVYVMEPGKVNLVFSDYLPEQKTVYGGAARVYGKGTSWMRTYHANPLYFAYTDQDADDRIDGLIDAACELSYIHAVETKPAKVEAETPQLELAIAAAAKTIHAPSPLALMGGRVSILNAPTVIEHETPATPVPVQIVDEVPAAAPEPEIDPRDEEIRMLREELTVQQFRFDQAEHEHRAEIADLRKRVKTELNKAPGGGASVATLIDMRNRIIEMQGELRAANTGNHRELSELRVENADLRRKLSDQQEQHRNKMAAARKKTKAGDESAPLTAWTPGLFSDPEHAVRHAVTVTWAHRVSAHDKAEYPLPNYSIGAEFADSLAKLDDGQVNKALRCAVDVLTDLARDLPSRRVHPLRTGDGVDKAPRTRADGAICFRANVESNVASARRLHYWKHDNGHIELSRVVVHDDMDA